MAAESAKHRRPQDASDGASCERACAENAPWPRSGSSRSPVRARGETWLVTDRRTRCSAGASRRSIPLGTAAVNVLGCWTIGFVMHLARQHQLLSPDARTVIVVRLLGSFTTFSAFGYETLELLGGGAMGLAQLTVLGNVVAGRRGGGLARHGRRAGVRILNREALTMKITGEALLLRTFICEKSSVRHADPLECLSQHEVA